MAVPKIAINGFGRIGRIVTRIAKMRHHFDVVAINDLTDPEHLAYVFKYDSVHGVYPGEVRLDGNTMVIDNDPFQVLSERDPAKLSCGVCAAPGVWHQAGFADDRACVYGGSAAGGYPPQRLSPFPACQPEYYSHVNGRGAGGWAGDPSLAGQ